MAPDVFLTPTALALFDALEPEPDEVAVISAAFTEAADGTLKLAQGSLIVGVDAMGENDWAAWGASHGITPVPGDTGRPAYRLDAPGFVGVRQPLSTADARAWLEDLLSTGHLRAIGAVPSATASLASAAAPIFISPSLDTPASGHVTRSVRPGRGALYPLETRRLLEYPQNWTDDAGHLCYVGGYPLGLHPGGPDEPCGLVVMRQSRTAWITGAKIDKSGTTYAVHLGHDPSRIDVAELELAIEERFGGEVLHARRLRLDQVPTDDVRGSPAFNVDVPSTGHGLERRITLYRNTGELLDMTGSYYALERIFFTVDVMGADPATRLTSTIGIDASAAVADREATVRAATMAWEEWLRLGVDQQVFKPGDDVRIAVTSRVRAARGELLIADRNFGQDPKDWDLVDEVKCQVRAVVSRGAAPERPRLNVDVRWLRAKVLTLHGRYYLWEGGGLYVDNSPAGFPTGYTTVTRIDPFASERLRDIFEGAWWIPAKTTPPTHPDVSDRWDEAMRRLAKRVKPVRRRYVHARNNFRGIWHRNRRRLLRR